jgi:hypothetical protein
MGLDLMLYVCNKAMTDKEIYDAAMDKPDKYMEEVCYGRKTWSLYYALRERSIDGDWLYEVSPEKWNRFVETVAQHLDESVRPALEDYISWTYDPNRTAEDEQANKDSEILEKFVDSIFDAYPQLGYDWETSAILRWYEMNDKIQTALKEGKKLILLASY